MALYRKGGPVHMRLNVVLKYIEKPQNHAIVSLACLIILTFNMPINSIIGESFRISELYDNSRQIWKKLR